ncbi:MAG: hypothetical protein ACOC22_00540 [bacterium]
MVSKIKKAAVGGLVSLLIPLQTMAQPQKTYIPDEFENYKKHAVEENFEIYENIPMFVKNYDVNEDGKVDVKEFYPILEIGSEGKKITITKNPMYYMFDLNNDTKFQRPEIRFDKKLDGLNGNEKIPTRKGVGFDRGYETEI